MTMPSPIGVSGPGALSQRVDKQPMRAPTGLGYGEAKALMEQQRGAPMAASPEVSAPSVQATPLSAPTQRPDEPVTAGSAFGPGPGPEALAPSGQPAGGQLSQLISRAMASDPSGTLADLLMAAQQRGL